MDVQEVRRESDHTPHRSACRRSRPEFFSLVAVYRVFFFFFVVARADRVAPCTIRINRTFQAQCGDPDCAPIDTIVRIIYQGQCGTVFGMPCEAWEVKPEDVEECMPPADFFLCWKNGEQKQWPPEPENPEPGEPPEIDLRFKVGDRVECCVARGPDGWRPGTVVSLWYRAASWPTGQFAPYQIKLDDHESLIFAPQDRDNCIRKAPAEA